MTNNTTQLRIIIAILFLLIGIQSGVSNIIIELKLLEIIGSSPSPCRNQTADFSCEVSINLKLDNHSSKSYTVLWYSASNGNSFSPGLTYTKEFTSLDAVHNFRVYAPDVNFDETFNFNLQNYQMNTTHLLVKSYMRFEMRWYSVPTFIPEVELFQNTATIPQTNICADQEFEIKLSTAPGQNFNVPLLFSYSFDNFATETFLNSTATSILAFTPDWNESQNGDQVMFRAHWNCFSSQTDYCSNKTNGAKSDPLYAYAKPDLPTITFNPIDCSDYSRVIPQPSGITFLKDGIPISPPLIPGETYVVDYSTAGSYCSYQETIKVPVLKKPSIALFEAKATCFNQNNGEVSMVVAGESLSYKWNDGPSTRNRNNLSKGTYAVTITDKYNCSILKSDILINEASGSIEIFDRIINPSCQNTNDGSIIFKDLPTGYEYYHPSGPLYPLMFINSEFEAEINGTLSAGSYNISATVLFENKGCDYLHNNIELRDPNLNITLNNSNVICKETASGNIKPTISGGTVPYTVKLYYGTPENNTFLKQNITYSNSTSFSVSASILPQQYILKIADKNNCIQNQISGIEIDEPINPLKIASSQSNILCKDASTGKITNNISGGWGLYTFQWDTPFGNKTTKDLDNLKAGSYTFTVTDQEGCSSIKSFQVTEPLTKISSSHQINEIKCDGDKGNVDLSISGGTKPYTIIFGVNGSYPDIYELSYASTFSKSINDLEANNYYFSIKDAYNCPGSFDTTFNLIMPPPLQITKSDSVRPSCYLDNDGSLTALASGGTIPYSYSWNTGGTNAKISNIAAGEYFLTVTDKNNCIQNNSFVLTGPGQISLSSFSPVKSNNHNLSCSNSSDGSIILSSLGGNTIHSYAYRTKGQVTWNASSENIINLQANIYEIKVNDEKGCSATDEISLTAPDPVNFTVNTFNITDDPAGCYGDASGRFTINAAGGSNVFSYALNNPDQKQTSNQFENLSAGPYTLYVFDDMGCSKTATRTIQQPSILSIGDITYTPIACFDDPGTEITIPASGGTPSLQYSLNGTTFQASSTFTNVEAQSYQISVKDAHNCLTTKEITISAPPKLNYTYHSQDVSCYGMNNGEISATASGGTGTIQYRILTQTFNEVNKDTIKNLSPGLYSMAIFDENGCTFNDEISITQPDSPLQFNPQLPIEFSVYPGNINVTQCRETDGWLRLNTTGGNGIHTYRYTFGDSTNEVTDTNLITGLRAGVYSIATTDENNCSLDTMVILTSPSELTIANLDITQPDCGASNASASVQITGGVEAYTYNWYQPGFGEWLNDDHSVTNLSSGLLILEVLDANNCVMIDSLAISDKNGTNASIANLKDVSCFGLKDGFAKLQIEPGSGPYQVTWYGTTNSVYDSAFNLQSGSYITEIINNTGCKTLVPFNIKAPGKIFVNATADTSIKCFGYQTGAISAHVNGGRTPYSYSIDNINFTADTAFRMLKADLYTIFVKDSTGCADSAKIRLKEPDQLQLMFAEINPVKCFGSATADITVSTAGGTPPYAYSRNGSMLTDSEVFTGLRAENHVIRVYDSNQCVTFIDTLLTEPEEIVLTPFEISASDCDAYTGKASIEVYGGIKPYLIAWSGPESATGTNIENAPPGTYTITVLDSNNCQQSTLIDILTIDGPVISSLETDSVSCYNAPDGFAKINITGGALPYQIKWNDSVETSVTENVNLAAGANSVKVIDHNGCVTTRGFYIYSPDSLLLTVTDYSNPVCYGQTSGEISINALGGSVPYQFFNLSETTAVPLENTILTGLSAGEYQFRVLDKNGCENHLVFTLTQPDPLSGNLDESLTICGGQSVELDGGPNASQWNWTSDNGYESSEQKIKIDAEGTYYLKLVNHAGCTAYDTISVSISNDLLESNFLMSSQVQVSDTFVVIEISWPVPTSVTWNLPDEILKIEEDESYMYLQATQPGTYYIGLNSMLGECKNYYEKELTVTGPIKEGNELQLGYYPAFEAKLYPNPTKESITILCESEYETGFSFQVYDMFGKLLEVFHQDGPLKQFEHKLDLAAYAPGVYYILIHSDKHTVKQKVTKY